MKTYRKFDDDLSSLKHNLLELLSAVKEEHVNALCALEKNNYEMSKKIIEIDKEIHNFSESLIITATWNIAQQQPFATDLRTIMGYMDIVRDLERISNYAKNISEFNLKYEPKENLTSQFSSLMAITFKMMDLIDQAIVENDIEIACKAAAYDHKIDENFRLSMLTIIDLLKITKDNDLISQYTSVIQQLKYIERLGDHLVNICETIVYINKGKFYDLGSLEINSSLKNDKKK